MTMPSATSSDPRGKVQCCVVLDTYSCRAAEWSIDSSPTAALAINAPGIAIETRQGNTTQTS